MFMLDKTFHTEDHLLRARNFYAVGTEVQSQAHLLVREHKARPRQRHNIARCPHVLGLLEPEKLIHIRILALIQQARIQKVRVRRQAHGRQVQVRGDHVAAGKAHLGPAVGQRPRRLDARVLAHLHAQLGNLPLDAGGNRVAAQDLGPVRQQDHLLVLVLEADLGAALDARRAGAGDHHVLGGADALGRLVQQLERLLVRARRLPGHGVVARERGRAGAGREDEVVVRERLVAGRGRDLGRLGGRVDARGGADDELEGLGRVLLEARLDGVEDLVVLDLAGDDGAGGGEVPVKVRVLRVSQRCCSGSLQMA